MIRLKTLDQLETALSNESSKRKKELIQIQSLLDNAKGANKVALNRTAVVIAYAHWEGFVKSSANYYVQHIASFAHPIVRLRAPFQALASKNSVIFASTATKKILPHLLVVRALVDDISTTKFTATENTIDTESNLSWDIFLNILMSLDVQTSFWLPYSAFIDELFKQRCGIAHGGLHVIDDSYAREVIVTVIMFIDSFSADISNAATLESYFR